MPRNIFKLILSIVICLAAGGVGSLFITSSIPDWYQTLNKPFFSPPNWVFGPVWTILYIMMGLSLYLVWTKKKVPTIFWIQLILNVAWSIIFFEMKNPALALVEIVALWIAIFLTIKAFTKINKLAGNLLIPYLLWVTFASFLNLSIVILNP
ncbi:MAG: tryptophan-rich sensory protein [Candidatus Daviesbacteria bacterium]|nr:tryptophan-rich sensory protein [Candidatus Daviesbacteria bacterium]